MNVKETKTDGVVSICDPKTIEIEWRNIPGYSQYQASNLGTIRRVLDNGIVKISKFYKHGTSVGTYLSTSVVSDSGLKRSFGLHQLVCAAFHGLPPRSIETYEVNHKDGNKHNNLPSNLEWMTRRENTLHALMTGLRNDNIPVRVWDLQTGEKVEYYSMVEAARTLNLPRNDLKKIVARHRIVPYQGRWLFDVDLTRLGNIRREHILGVKAWDYVAEKEIMADDCSALSYLTGIHHSTIKFNTVDAKKLKSGNNRLVGGYVFKFQSDISPYPEISKETAQASRDKYYSRMEMKREVPIVVKNYLTGEVMEFKSSSEAIRKLSNVTGSVVENLRNGSLNLYKGQVFKKKDDSRPFPDYHPDYVKASLMSSVAAAPPVKVTDIISNTTKLYSSASQFAKDVGLDPDSIRERIRCAKGKPLVDRYTFEWIPMFNIH